VTAGRRWRTSMGLCGAPGSSTTCGSPARSTSMAGGGRLARRSRATYSFSDDPAGGAGAAASTIAAAMCECDVVRGEVGVRSSPREVVRDEEERVFSPLDSLTCWA
jgi:hypothetical protein